MALTLTSSAFDHNGIIPRHYTCEGDDVSVPLQWEGAPEGTKSLALLVDDPDAPDPQAPKMVFAHWILYNLPADTVELPEGASPKHLPSGAREGENDFGNPGYGGPCPPTGRHRYFHKLFALDTALDGLDNPKKADLEKAIQGHVLASAELVGTYQKGD